MNKKCDKVDNSCREEKNKDKRGFKWKKYGKI